MKACIAQEDSYIVNNDLKKTIAVESERSELSFKYSKESIKTLYLLKTGNKVVEVG